jgi:hypothetical protein
MSNMSHEADDLVLYAVNTGELYPQALRLAREGASLSMWLQFANQAADRYRREIPNSRFRFTIANKREAARELKNYYDRHVREGDRPSRRRDPNRRDPKAPKLTSAQHYQQARRKSAASHATMLDLLFGSNPISDDELRKLIAKRPEIYGKYAGYLGKRAGRDKQRRARRRRQ